jgi:Ca2+/Na+ antiporter
MKTNYLFPPVYRKIGWWLFVPSFVLGILLMAGVLPDNLLTCTTPMLFGEGHSLLGINCIEFGSNDWLDEIILICLSVSLIFLSFSREVDEDECIAEIRMRSFVWAIKANTLLIIACTLTIFGFAYLYFMIIFMFTMFLFFLVKYEIALYKFRKDNYEK